MGYEEPLEIVLSVGEDERLMVRIVAFALDAHENLEMTNGLSTDDEPDIWQKA